MCELKCANCALGTLFKSGVPIERINRDVEIISTQDGSDFIARDCLTTEDPNWRSEEFVERSATCVHPDRFQPKETTQQVVTKQTV